MWLELQSLFLQLVGCNNDDNDALVPSTKTQQRQKSMREEAQRETDVCDTRKVMKMGPDPANIPSRPKTCNWWTTEIITFRHLTADPSDFSATAHLSCSRHSEPILSFRHQNFCSIRSTEQNIASPNGRNKVEMTICLFLQSQKKLQQTSLSGPQTGSALGWCYVGTRTGHWNWLTTSNPPREGSQGFQDIR